MSRRTIMLVCVYEVTSVPIRFMWLQPTVAIVFLVIYLRLVIDYDLYLKSFQILAKSIGSDDNNLLNYCDAENHKPLHLSVIGNSRLLEFLKYNLFI